MPPEYSASDGATPHTATMEADMITEFATDQHITATGRFFAITELVEGVLMRVDLKTLLLSQRVTHRFEDVVVGSHLLQKKPFFKPVESFEEALALGLAEEDGILATEKAFGDVGDNFLHPAFVNTLLVATHGTLWGGILARDHSFGLRYNVVGRVAKTTSTRGSWARMSLTQPPIRGVLDACTRMGSWSSGSWQITTNKYQSGRTVAQVIEGVLEQLRKGEDEMPHKETRWMMRAMYDDERNIRPFIGTYPDGRLRFLRYMLERGFDALGFATVTRVDDDGHYHITPYSRKQ